MKPNQQTNPSQASKTSQQSKSPIKNNDSNPNQNNQGQNQTQSNPALPNNKNDPAQIGGQIKPIQQTPTGASSSNQNKTNQNQNQQMNKHDSQASNIAPVPNNNPQQSQNNVQEPTRSSGSISIKRQSIPTEPDQLKTEPDEQQKNEKIQEELKKKKQKEEEEKAQKEEEEKINVIKTQERSNKGLEYAANEDIWNLDAKKAYEKLPMNQNLPDGTEHKIKNSPKSRPHLMDMFSERSNSDVDLMQFNQNPSKQKILNIDTDFGDELPNNNNNEPETFHRKSVEKEENIPETQFTILHKESFKNSNKQLPRVKQNGESSQSSFQNPNGPPINKNSSQKNSQKNLNNNSSAYNKSPEIMNHERKIQEISRHLSRNPTNESLQARTMTSQNITHADEIDNIDNNNAINNNNQQEQPKLEVHQLSPIISQELPKQAQDDYPKGKQQSTVSPEKSLSQTPISNLSKQISSPKVESQMTFQDPIFKSRPPTVIAQNAKQDSQKQLQSQSEQQKQDLKLKSSVQSIHANNEQTFDKNASSPQVQNYFSDPKTQKSTKNIDPNQQSSIQTEQIQQSVTQDPSSSQFASISPQTLSQKQQSTIQSQPSSKLQSIQSNQQQPQKNLIQQQQQKSIDQSEDEEDDEKDDESNEPQNQQQQSQPENQKQKDNTQSNPQQQQQQQSPQGSKKNLPQQQQSQQMSSPGSKKKLLSIEDPLQLQPNKEKESPIQSKNASPTFKMAQQRQISLIHGLFPNKESESKILDSAGAKKIKDWLPKPLDPQKILMLTLLYRGNRDGFTSQAFHQKCDKQYPTLSIIKAKKTGNVFGGYTEASWMAYKESYGLDKNAFIFSVTNGTKHPVKDVSHAINNRLDYLVRFGGTDATNSDLAIAENCNQNKNSYSEFGFSYEGGETNNKNQEYLAGSYKFTVENIEVYLVQHFQ